MNTASINATTTAQTQKILDAISASEIQSLRDKVSSLELAQATSSVVRYPTSMSYAYNANPFCGGGCGCGNF